MTMAPMCAPTPEEPGAQFEPPVIGIPFQRGQRRLREARAFDKVAKETAEFHERRARRYGLDRPRGQLHLHAARLYREAAGRLQEMFENGGELGELPPKAIMKVNKAAMDFHKKQAEKAGLDSDEGHAHIAALEHHMDIFNKAKQQVAEAAFGHSSKQSPVPVPKKSDQPSEDVRQPLPPVPLAKLQQRRESKVARRISRFGREASKSINMGTKRSLPGTVTGQLEDNLIFRGERHRRREGPKAAAPRVHGGHDVTGGTLDRESCELEALRRSL